MLNHVQKAKVCWPLHHLVIIIRLQDISLVKNCIPVLKGGRMSDNFTSSNIPSAISYIPLLSKMDLLKSHFKTNAVMWRRMSEGVCMYFYLWRLRGTSIKAKRKQCTVMNHGFPLSSSIFLFENITTMQISCTYKHQQSDISSDKHGKSAVLQIAHS